MNADSEHFVLDIVRERIGCAWAFEALDEELAAWPKVDDVFFRLDEVLFVRRQRMSRLNAMAFPKPDEDGAFIGYTHFGFDGRPSPDIAGDIWSDGWRDFSVRAIERMLDLVQPENPTLQQLVRRLTGDEAAA